MTGKAFVTDKGDALIVGYEDFDVDLLGGGDYEATYLLSKENRLKLYKALTAEGHTGNLSHMVLDHFGLSLEKESFSDYCSRHGIVFQQHVWID